MHRLILDMLPIQPRERLAVVKIRYFLEDFKGIYQKEMKSLSFNTEKPIKEKNDKLPNLTPISVTIRKRMMSHEIDKNEPENSFSKKAFLISKKRYSQNHDRDNDKSVFKQLLCLKQEFEEMKQEKILKTSNMKFSIRANQDKESGAEKGFFLRKIKKSNFKNEFKEKLIVPHYFTSQNNMPSIINFKVEAKMDQIKNKPASKQILYLNEALSRTNFL